MARLNRNKTSTVVVVKAAVYIFVLSLVLISVSLSMDAFRLGPGGSYPMFDVPDENSQAYFLAREQALTAKFSLQDYGLTLLISALALAAFKRKPLKAPRSRFGFVVLAVAAPVVSASAFVFDLLQGQARSEFPPWADSLGIPFMGVPALVIFGLFWAFSHLILLLGARRCTCVPLTVTAIRRAHPWLKVVCVLTIVLILAMGVEGAYWYAVPGAVWLYFYASIAAVRHEYTANPSSKRSPDSAA